MKLRVIVIIIVAAIVLLAAYSIIKNTAEIYHSKNITHTTPDAIVTDGTIYTYNKQGQLGRVTTATSLQHYDNKKQSVLSKPRMQLSSSGGGVWNITSNNAISKNNNQIINLSGNVIFQRPEYKNKPKTTITSRKASVRPKQKLITSSDEVTIDQPNSTITGTGLSANTDTGIFILKSKVTAIYVDKNLQN